MCSQSVNEGQRIHLSDIYRDHFPGYLKSGDRKLFLEDKHLEAVNKSSACRTEKLGIALFSCPDCGDTRYVGRSCKHRFCSRCGASDTMRWAEQRLSHLLVMKHHHITWTLPKSFRHLSKLNGNFLYNLLFRVSADVIKSWFLVRHGLKVGIINVLHTAGSDLKYHPHIHMIVSRGGQSITDEDDYREVGGDYLCPQKFLGKQFRIKIQQSLIKSYDKGQLKVGKRIESHSDFVSWLYTVKQEQWVVKIQDALEDPSHIVAYVGRYTKRTCLSEYKIKEAGELIKFEYKDYKHTPKGEQPRIAIRTMQAVAFLDELLQHVPDKGYQMVRYYGIYNSRYIRDIPDHLRPKIKSSEISFDEDYDWGEFELFRKVVILSGRSDPLYCEICNRSMVWVGYLLKGEFISIEVYDSS